MILAIDFGNSSVKTAVFDGMEPVASARFSTSEREWHSALGAWVGAQNHIRHVGLSSVVPAGTTLVAALLEAHGLPPPLLLHAALPLPIRVAYATPHTLGADRLAAAVAAWQYCGSAQAVVAIDAGTALTYEIVTADGTYLGGAIAPGPELLVRSLATGTAQLSHVPFETPLSAIGDTTQTALQSGLAFGFLDGVTGMLRRVSDVLGTRPHVVATGGWALWLAEQTTGIDTVRPHLVLEGVRDVVGWQATHTPG